jgi:hypothetical protein
MIKNDFVGHVWETGKYFQKGLRRVCSAVDLDISFSGYPPVFGFDFGVADSMTLKTLLTQEFAKRGVHGGTHANMMYALKNSDLDEVLKAFKEIAPILKDAIENDRVNDLLDVPIAEELYKPRMDY